jgi:hypothetical protein
MIVANLPKKRLVPLTATFAAIYGTLKLLPISAWIGGSGRVFTATEFVAPLLGMVLGPYAGSVAGVVGTFAGVVFTGRTNFFGLDFLPVVVNALILGFMIRKRLGLSALLYSVLLALFFVHPSTLHFISVPMPDRGVQVPFVWLHIVVWILVLSPLSRKAVDWLAGKEILKATTAAFLLSLIGTTAQHLAGTLLFASMAVPLMGITPETLNVGWVAVFYVYPVERLIIVVAATVVTLATVRALKPMGLVGVSGENSAAAGVPANNTAHGRP